MIGVLQGYSLMARGEIEPPAQGFSTFTLQTQILRARLFFCVFLVGGIIHLPANFERFMALLCSKLHTS